MRPDDADEGATIVAITAKRLAGQRQLNIEGDPRDNTITVSRDFAGNLLVNNGAVSVTGGTPTVANTD